MCERLLTALGFTEFDLGDIGEQHHPPTVTGRALADLQPAPVMQAVHRVFFSRAAQRLGEQAGAVHQALDLSQAHATDDADPATGPKGLEPAIEQHDTQVLIEQHERIRDALNRIDQVLMGRLGAQSGVAEQMIAGLEFSHCLVQRIGTLAHLLGQDDRVLECRVGIVRTRSPRLQAFNQRRIDSGQFLIGPLELGNLLRCANLGAVQWQHR